MSGLEKRLAALEARVPSNNDVRVILVTFPAAAGAREPKRIVDSAGASWIRQVGEDVETFRCRAKSEVASARGGCVALLFEHDE